MYNQISLTAFNFAESYNPVKISIEDDIIAISKYDIDETISINIKENDISMMICKIVSSLLCDRHASINIQQTSISISYDDKNFIIYTNKPIGLISKMLAAQLRADDKSTIINSTYENTIKTRLRNAIRPYQRRHSKPYILGIVNQTPIALKLLRKNHIDRVTMQLS